MQVRGASTCRPWSARGQRRSAHVGPKGRYWARLGISQAYARLGGKGDTAVGSALCAGWLACYGEANMPAARQPEFHGITPAAPETWPRLHPRREQGGATPNMPGFHAPGAVAREEDSYLRGAEPLQPCVGHEAPLLQPHQGAARDWRRSHSGHSMH